MVLLMYEMTRFVAARLHPAAWIVRCSQNIGHINTLILKHAFK